jgi:hypothetical protein
MLANKKKISTPNINRKYTENNKTMQRKSEEMDEKSKK